MYPKVGSMNKRIEWIDWCKAFAIFFVVWLHIHSNQMVDIAINGFIMPLFFSISGYLFKFENNPSGKLFFRKRFRQLVVPYIWINLVAYLLWVFVLRNYGTNTLDQISWHTPLMAIFTGIGPLLAHDIPLWSLLSFFVVEMIFYFLSSIGLRWYWILGIFLVLFCVLVTFIPDTIGSLPMMAGPSIAGVCFYSLGYGWRESLRHKIATPLSPGLRIGLRLTILAICIVAFGVAVDSTGNISFYTCRIGNIPGFFVAGITGSVVVIALCKFISTLGNTPYIVRMVSVGTLIICGFHLIILAAIKGVMLFTFKISPDTLTNGFFHGLFLALIIIVASIPLIWFIRKYARPLVDK